MKTAVRASAAVLMTLLAAAVQPSGTSAAPGVPDPPTVLFSESFENNPQQTVTQGVPLR
ncbi:MAG: hypothetical protein ACRDLN_03505 [Solirubrobacteraceae bacterium]